MASKNKRTARRRARKFYDRFWDRVIANKRRRIARQWLNASANSALKRRTLEQHLQAMGPVVHTKGHK